MESKHNRTMEKLGKSNGRREGMEGKNKGDDGGRIGVSGPGVRWGEGWRDKSVAGARLYWMAAGKQRSPHSEGCQWLLMFGGRCVAGGAHG